MDAAVARSRGRAWARGGDGWIIPIQGQLVTQLRFDLAVSLVFVDGFEVRVEQPFTLSQAGDLEQTLDPEGEPRSLALALGLSRATAVGGFAFDDGRLELTFRGGSRLMVGAGAEFEAWQISAPRGLLVVSSPGGGLTTWELGDEA